MKEILLILHFFGLAIGAGGPFFMALYRPAALRFGGPEARPYLGTAARTANILAKTGVTLLIVTGIAMVWSGDYGTLTSRPMFYVKLLAVALVVLYVGIMHVLIRRAMAGDTGAAQRMAQYAPAGLVIAPLPVIFAVLAFS
jgi:uncharacterized membrane protein